MVFKRTSIKSYLLFISVVLISHYSFAQEMQPALEDLIENIASSSDNEIDYTSLYDDLNYFLNNPLNINTAKRADLEKLQILNDFQINSLLDYRKQNGKMLSVYELQLVFGFTLDDIYKLLPFITIEDTPIDDSFSLKTY